MAGDPETQVFRIPREWWGKFDRTANEVLHKLGFVQLPDGGWACGKDTAHRVVNTVCAYSFGWDDDATTAPEPARTPLWTGDLGDLCSIDGANPVGGEPGTTVAIYPTGAAPRQDHESPEAFKQRVAEAERPLRGIVDELRGQLDELAAASHDTDDPGTDPDTEAAG